MHNRTVFFVSDQTGITAETLGHSLLTQFEGVEFRQITLPFIKTVDKAHEAVRKIDLTARAEGCKPIVFCTFVQEELGGIVRASNGLCLDFFEAFIGPLERELELSSTHTTGKAHGLANDAAYTTRIDAMNFALATDDGISAQGLGRADIILVGISRTGKTPTCLFLALQYGFYAANYPLTEDDFERGDLPAALKSHKQKLFGLTIEQERLREIREERRPNSAYASNRQISYELRESAALFRRHGIPSIETTQSSVEEIAVKIMQQAGLERRDRR